MRVTKSRSGIVTVIDPDINAERGLHLLGGLRHIKISTAKKQGDLVVTNVVNGSFSTLERNAVWSNPVISIYQIEL